MGEAKRRKERRAINKTLAGMHAEGQGVWDLMIYDPPDVATVMEAARAGDSYARRTVLMLDSVMRRVRAANPPDLCLTCDHEFTAKAMPRAWVLTHAHRDEPRNAMSSGICAACHARYPGAALLPVVTDVYRRNLISDLRVLSPTSEPGHA
jgi:hypothetical protein